MKIWHGLIDAVTAVAVGVAVLMVIVINADVFSRLLLDAPIHLAVELTTFGFAITTFLPLVLVARERREISDDLLKGRIPEKIETALQAFYHVVGSLTIFVIFYYVLKKFIWAYQVGDYIPSSPLLYTAVPWGAIALGLLLYGLELLRQAGMLAASLFGHAKLAAE